MLHCRCCCSDLKKTTKQSLSTTIIVGIGLFNYIIAPTGNLENFLEVTLTRVSKYMDLKKDCMVYNGGIFKC